MCCNPLSVRLAISLAAALCQLGTFGARCEAQPAKKTSPRDAILEQLWILKPAERMDLLSNVVKQSDFATAERGAVANAVIERASLDAAKKSDIVCNVKPLSKNALFAVIKWLVADGAAVKKGDKLIDFDTSSYQNELDRQKRLVAKAKADLQKADTQFKRVQKDNAIDVQLAEIEVRLAELALKQYMGNDANQKQILALQVDRASLIHMRAKIQAEVKDEKAAAETQAKKAIHERELASQQEIESVIAGCVMHAPQDGMAVYFIPEQRRGPAGAVIAEGEPVREGQKLMRICDLKQMVAIARIHEASISKLRVGQNATIRVDAFPARSFTGKVNHIATTADQAGFLNSDVKVYRVAIAIDGENKVFRPGMSAETAVSIAEGPPCLRLPNATILSRNKERYCYVQIGKELQSRKLTIGLTDGSFVEIIDGLKEGDVVLRNPQAVADRLATIKKP